jgi:signal peptidase I
MIKTDDILIREHINRVWKYNDTPVYALILAAVCFFILVVLPNYLYRPYSVFGVSMMSTLHNLDTVVIYKQGVVDYGDIVVLYLPESSSDKEDFIKRLMGKPGDTVWFEKGTADGRIVYRFVRERDENGMTVRTTLENEYYTDPGPDGYPVFTSSNYPETKVTLKDDEYYVLGDNRNNSNDSRGTTIGIVSRADIVGKALFIIRDGKWTVFEKVIY